MKWSLCSEKFETFEIWADVPIRGPHIVMSRTDAQNGLDFHFNTLTLFLQNVIRKMDDFAFANCE
jgi:hypothetical protein